MKEELQTAQARGYLQTRNAARDRELAAQWLHECQEAQRPFVRITAKITRGAVTFDIEPTGKRLNAAGIDAVRRAILATPGARDNCYIFGNLTRVGGLYLEDCQTLAAALVKIGSTEEYIEHETTD